MRRNQHALAGALGLFIVGLILIVISTARAQSGAPQAASTSANPKKAEEQFKNIQTLKGIPADQLIPAMQFITASLGVECDFCHVQGAFEKDDKKPKEIARKMMAMMFTINQENFDGHREVTCYSCHRGSTKPVGVPIVGVEQAKSPSGEMQMADAETAGAKPSGPTGDQLIDKYVQAVGGANAIDKVTSRIAQGTIDFGGTSYPVDVYSKDPEKRASFVHMPDGDNITAFNGHEGWLGVPDRPVRDMHGPDLDGAAIDADLHLATHLKQMFSELAVRSGDEIDGHNTYLVYGKREGKPPLRLYFDSQSGLLLRLVRYGETPLGLLPTQVDYADYRNVSGVKIPFRWTLSRPGGQFTIQAKDIKQNVEVDDAKFAKPASPPAESGK